MPTACTLHIGSLPFYKLLRFVRFPTQAERWNQRVEATCARKCDVTMPTACTLHIGSLPFYKLLRFVRFPAQAERWNRRVEATCARKCDVTMPTARFTLARFLSTGFPALLGFLLRLRDGTGEWKLKQISPTSDVTMPTACFTSARFLSTSFCALLGFLLRLRDGTGEWKLTLILLEANSTNTKECKKPEKSLKLWQMGSHLKVLSESFPMSTNMTGFRWFSKIFAFLCIGQMYSLSIGRVKKFAN